MHNIKYFLENYNIRRTEIQKEKFRQWLKKELNLMGYEHTFDVYKKHSRGVNVIVGDIDKAKVILTAHYDTPAIFVLPFYYTFPKGKTSFIISQLVSIIPIFLICKAIAYVIKYITVSDTLASLGFSISLICISLLVFYGRPNKTNYNDNTSGVVSLLSIMKDLPPSNREKVAFVFFDQEELGLLGSRAFKKKYKDKLEMKTIINFDCVSEGDYIFFVTDYFYRLSENHNILEKVLATTECTNKKLILSKSSTFIFHSDNRIFENNIGVIALKKNMFGYYINKIHTARDTVFDYRNIDLITMVIQKYINEL